ncbi:hypothetical protein [Streptococcus marimammalium]|uniref:hypothetical protein n=1 Tax=Streptococcus marimammalium TaxID=269666 RepID=UPI00037CAAC8|nr:hypothetical protein [Streptococcus marimammalium]
MDKHDLENEIKNQENLLKHINDDFAKKQKNYENKLNQLKNKKDQLEMMFKGKKDIVYRHLTQKIEHPIEETMALDKLFHSYFNHSEDIYSQMKKQLNKDFRLAEENFLDRKNQIRKELDRLYADKKSFLSE